MKDFLNDWGITLMVFLPLVGAVLMMLIPKAEEELHKLIALISALAVAVVGVLLTIHFDWDRTQDLQFQVDKSWIDVIHSRYTVAVDGISMPLILLTLLVVPLVIIYSWDHFPEPHNPKAFLILILVLHTGMLGSFVAQDLILFFVFFEVVLLPMYFMIGVWGGEERQYASIKFFLFTLFGSALMIVSFLALFFVTGAETFNMAQLAVQVGTSDVARTTQILLFGGMFMGFGIKVPMFPFHTWLPDAHTQAPTQGSVILAAVLLKLGTYGFVRIALPILPEGAHWWAPIIGGLACVGIIYGALGCLAQTDMKRLIAFSSVAHMGYVMLGIATLTDFGINAAIFGMVAHGLITGMLFFIAGSMKERFHTLEIARLGGLLKQAPHMGWMLGFTSMASLGLPGLAGFWGEFPVILAAYNPAEGLNTGLFRFYMFVAALGTVLAAAYLLWLFQRTAFGAPKEEFAHEHVHDAHVTEWIAWLPMLVLIVVLGFVPVLVFGMTSDAVSVVAQALGAEVPVLATLLAQAAQAPFDKPTIDFHALAPEIVLVALTAFILLVDVVKLEDARRLVPGLTGLAMLASTIPLVSLALDGDDRSMFGGAYVVDNLALVLKAMFLLSGYVVTLLASNYVAEGDFWESEFYVMMLSSIMGMVVMSSARDLVTIFVALELLSIPAYLMASWEKRNLRSNEAGLKYYLMGVFASALMLYGMSLLFGVTGSTLLTEIGASISEGASSTPIVTLGIVLVIVGFGFKVSAVPFHSWAPDTYEGAPTPVTAFLAVASKAAGFVALIQLVFIGFLGRSDVVEPMMWVLAAASMTVGNLIALRQHNIVRLLAYSGVAQAGFMLAPFAVVGTNASDALTAVVTYLLIYAAMNLAAFAVVIAVSRKTRSGEVTSFGGLFGYAPGLAVAMTVSLASLAGIPPLGGWFAKFVVFRALTAADTAAGYTLAIVVAVNSVIAFYYYGLVLRAMWFDEAPDGDTTRIRVPISLVSALGLTVAATVLFGVFPGLIGHFTGNLDALLATVAR